MGAERRPGGNQDRERTHETFSEQQLPTCVRDILHTARSARPETEVACVAFQTVENGRVIARLGPDVEVVGGPGISSARSFLRAKDHLVLSVSVTETMFATVRTVTHVLVTLEHGRSLPISTSGVT